MSDPEVACGQGCADNGGMGAATQPSGAAREQNAAAHPPDPLVLRTWAFACGFLDWTEDDAAAVRESAPLIGPHIDGLVDAAFDQFVAFAETAQFFTRPDGTLDEPYLHVHKKRFLAWMTTVASGRDDADYARFLASVGRTHTPLGGDPSVVVPRRLIVALMGWLSVAVCSVLHAALAKEPDRLRRATLAWQKRLHTALVLFMMEYR
ncbi:MAG TPA: protoglobin family protein [Chthonomonadales bacterium]|nr:protoglobin family protein [Chthonomonadales bacterium]